MELPVFDVTQLEEGLRINVSAYRLLFIYLLLCQAQTLSPSDLNTHLLNHPMVQRTLTVETLNNYIHTLQVFGCDIHNTDGHGQIMLHLKEHPLKYPIPKDHLNIIQLICAQFFQHPLASTYHHFLMLIRRIIPFNQIQEIYQNVSNKIPFEHQLSTADIQLAERFQRYCIDGQVLVFDYEMPDGKSISKMVEPLEITYHRKRLTLVGNDPKTNKKVRLDVERIHHCRQLPNRSRSQAVKTMVTFKLMGRIASNYRPYPGETVVQKGDSLLVKHKTDEVDQLLKRLLRYGATCQVLSPNSARKEMLYMIDRMLNGLLPHNSIESL